MAVSTHLAGVVEAAGTEVVELWQRWHGLEGAEQDGGETLSDAGVQLLEVSTGVVSLEQWQREPTAACAAATAGAAAHAGVDSCCVCGFACRLLLQYLEL